MWLFSHDSQPWRRRVLALVSLCRKTLETWPRLVSGKLEYKDLPAFRSPFLNHSWYTFVSKMFPLINNSSNMNLGTFWRRQCLLINHWHDIGNAITAFAARNHQVCFSRVIFLNLLIYVYHLFSVGVRHMCTRMSTQSADDHLGEFSKPLCRGMR